MGGTTNSDCYTGWNAHDYMEAWEPTAAEQATITYLQRVGTDNGSDGSGNVLSMAFTNKTSSPYTRILYFDNLRVVGSNRWCRWEARVDGKSCAAPLAGRVHQGWRQRPLPVHDRGRMPQCWTRQAHGHHCGEPEQRCRLPHWLDARPEGHARSH